MESFEIYLRENDYSGNTIRSYSYTIRQYSSMYQGLSHDNLIRYREFLIRTYSVSTANLRINGMNTYLTFRHSRLSPLKIVKTSQRQFCDDIVSNEEFRTLKAGLYDRKNKRDYFLIRLLASTGMRISELLQITVRDIENGYKDIISKGDKQRRVYFPEALNRMTREWLHEENITDGCIFRSSHGRQLSQSGMRYVLRRCAREYNISVKHVHPHAFRHRYALNFLKSNPDIMLLADLLGHESIETTRLYLKRTQEEQKRIVNEVVNW